MGKSPMEAERTAVQAVLETRKTAPTDDPVFGLLAEAEQAGTLDAAIFALLPDRPLFSEFQAWRNANHMWFVAYISEHLAPIPAAILALPPGVPLSGGAPAPTPAGSVP